MTPQQLQAMKLALKDLRCMASDLGRFENEIPSIKAIKKALAQPEHEPDYWLGYGLQAHTEKPFEGATPLYTKEQL